MKRDQPTRRQLLGGIFAGLFGMGLGPGPSSSSAAPIVKTWPAASDLGSETTYAFETEDGVRHVLTYDAQGRLIIHHVTSTRRANLFVRTYSVDP